MKKKTEKAKPEETTEGKDSFLDFMGDFQALWHGFFSEQFHAFNENAASSLFSDKDSREFHDLFRKSAHDKMHNFFRNMAIGPFREYQEKINRCGEEFGKWELSCRDFFILLSRPLEESWKELEKEWLAGKAEDKDKLSPDAVFRRWIEILERRYMSLYESEEFVSAMNQALQDSAALAKARIALEDEFLKHRHLPTAAEMDDLYKDLYFLRKRVESLEKAQKGKRKSHVSSGKQTSQNL